MLDFLQYEFNSISIIATIVAACLLVYQLVYYFVLYGKLLAFYKKKKDKNKSFENTNNNIQGVSIVIVTNNNGDALRERLLQVLEQDYPLFEVVVVNENSTDNTEFILFVLKDNYPNLKVINLEKNANNFENNKFSLAIGIRSAKYDNVLLTTVSCEPKGYNWLNRMMKPINEDYNKKIITGICLREPANGLANILEQYDLAISYMNLIPLTLYGNAYTSCGNNMIYNKKFLLNNGGFIAQYTNNCNQEDFFVHKFSTKKNTTIVASKDSSLYVPKYPNFKTFLRVKFAESLSKKVLKNKDKLLLATLPINAFLFYIAAAFLIFIGFPWQYIVFSCVIKWTIQIIYLKKCSKRLNIKTAWLFAPLLEFLFFIFNFITRIKVLFFKRKRTKIRWD